MYIFFAFLAENIHVYKIITAPLEVISPDKDLHNILDILKLFWAANNLVFLKPSKTSIGPVSP